MQIGLYECEDRVCVNAFCWQCKNMQLPAVKFSFRKTSSHRWSLEVLSKQHDLMVHLFVFHCLFLCLKNEQQAQAGVRFDKGRCESRSL